MRLEGGSDLPGVKALQHSSHNPIAEAYQHCARSAVQGSWQEQKRVGGSAEVGMIQRLLDPA